MVAYSQPITPPPSTAIVLGMESVSRIESESQIVRLFNGMSAPRRGREPVAITM